MELKETFAFMIDFLQYSVSSEEDIQSRAEHEESAGYCGF
jgi:hypothetical protein